MQIHVYTERNRQISESGSFAASCIGRNPSLAFKTNWQQRPDFLGDAHKGSVQHGH